MENTSTAAADIMWCPRRIWNTGPFTIALFDSSRISWAWDPASPRYPGIDWEHPSPFIQKMMREKPEAHPDLVKEEKPEEEQDLDSEGRKPHLLYAPDGIEKTGNIISSFCMDDDREGVAVSDRPRGPLTARCSCPAEALTLRSLWMTTGRPTITGGRLMLMESNCMRI